jgi:acetoin:2,6-dichlorophenolindophenol oxidoreductase subunit beta
VVDIAFRTAIRDALSEEMERDDSVFVMGEDVRAGGVFHVTPDLLARFGPDRVIDTPISELGFTGAAFGAAMRGMRPVIEIMFGDFLALSLDALVNQAGRLPFVTNGQIRAPLVIRTAVGGGVGYGPLHSEVPTNWVFGEPGIKVVAPSAPANAKGLLKAAIRDDEPVVFFEHKLLYDHVDDVPEGSEATAIGRAAVVRWGDDVTVVAAMAMVGEAIAAAVVLETEGVSVEVIDLLSLRPLDVDSVLLSAARTGRLVVVEEGRPVGGYAAELLASALEADAEIVGARVTMPDFPVPFNTHLERQIRPTPERIAATVRNVLEKRSD